MNYPTFLPYAGCDTRSVVFFIVDYNRFKFSFPSPRPVAIPGIKSPVCPTILSIAGWRIVGFIAFPSKFQLCEIQTVLSRI